MGIDVIFGSRIYVKITNFDKYEKFLKNINEIDNFLEFFDCQKPNDIARKTTKHKLDMCSPGESDAYLEIEMIEQIFNSLIDICQKYDYELFLRAHATINDDTDFCYYYVVKDNILHDIHEQIAKEKANIIKKIIRSL